MPVVVTTDDINLILSAMGVALLVLMRPEMHATVAAVVVSIIFNLNGNYTSLCWLAEVMEAPL